MNHPFSWVPEDRQPRLLAMLVSTTIVLMLVMGILGAPLQTPEAPTGIVSFELAKTHEASQAMLASWDSRARLYAALGIGFDYLFMVSYALSIALACVRVASRFSGRQAGLLRIGIVLAWAQPIAAVLDAAENYALVHIVLGSLDHAWPEFAYYCAVPKFVIVTLGLIYVIMGASISLAGSMRRNRS